jgi:hypothetical protein
MQAYWWVPVVLWIVGHAIAVVGRCMQDGIEDIDNWRGE